MLLLAPLAKGSLVQIAKPCIRPNCVLCRKGIKHKSCIYTFYRGGKKRTMYVPLGLVSQMKNALCNSRKLEKLLVEAGIEMIKEFRRRREKRRK